MVIDYNKDIIARIRVARNLMNEVFEPKRSLTEKEVVLLEAKRKNLSLMLQEIGSLVVLHYPCKHNLGVENGR